MKRNERFPSLASLLR